MNYFNIAAMQSSPKDEASKKVEGLIVEKQRTQQRIAELDHQIHILKSNYESAG